ncbi:MAG: ATP-binding protein [Bacteroidales bacterium]
MAKLDLLNLEVEEVVGSLKGIVEIWVSSNNCGKTYNASKMPKPIILQCEAGGRGVNCHKVGVTSWGDFMDAIKQLTNPKTLEQMQNKFETVVIDTLENMVMYSDNAVAQQFGVGTLGEITGRQNGYVISRTQIAMAISKLTSCNYHVIFLTHEEVVEVEDEVNSTTYNFIIPKGSNNEKSSARALRDMADVVVYLKSNPYDVENDKEVLSTAIYKRTKSVFARSRFSDLPFMLPNFNAKQHQEILLEAIKKRAEREECGITDYDSKQPTNKEEWFEEIKPLLMKIHGFNPDKATEIVENQLGEGKKVSQATDNDLIKLENIYTSMLTYCVQFNL